MSETPRLGRSATSYLAAWIAEHDGVAKVRMGDPGGWVVTLECEAGSTWGDSDSLDGAILDAIDSGAAGGL